MLQKREQFSIKIRKEQREKQFEKKRSIQHNIKEPNVQDFLTIIRQTSISLLLQKMDDNSYLEVISYLSCVNDHQCSQYLMDQGVYNETIQVTQNLVKNYSHSINNDIKFNYLLSILGNLIDFINFPNIEFMQIILEAIKISEKAQVSLIETVNWLIDIYSQKQNFQDDELVNIYNFLFCNLHHNQLQSQLLDTIINLLIGNNKIMNEDNLQDMQYPLNNENNLIIVKCCQVLWEVRKLKFPKDIFIKLNQIIDKFQCLPLLQLCNYFYPKIILDSTIIIEKLENLDEYTNINQYCQIAQKLINDEILCSNKFCKILELAIVRIKNIEDKNYIQNLLNYYQD